MFSLVPDGKAYPLYIAVALVTWGTLGRLHDQPMAKPVSYKGHSKASHIQSESATESDVYCHLSSSVFYQLPYFDISILFSNLDPKALVYALHRHKITGSIKVLNHP